MTRTLFLYYYVIKIFSGTLQWYLPKKGRKGKRYPGKGIIYPDGKGKEEKLFVYRDSFARKFEGTVLYDYFFLVFIQSHTVSSTSYSPIRYGPYSPIRSHKSFIQSHTVWAIPYYPYETIFDPIRLKQPGYFIVILLALIESCKKLKNHLKGELPLENTRVQWEKRVPNKVLRSTGAKEIAWGVKGIDGKKLEETATLYQKKEHISNCNGEIKDGKIVFEYKDKEMELPIEPIIHRLIEDPGTGVLLTITAVFKSYKS